MKVDHLASLGGKVRPPGSERVNDVLGRGRDLTRHERREGQRAQAERGILQEMPARLQMELFPTGMHGRFPLSRANQRFMSISSRFKSTLPTTVDAASSAMF